jgi:nicotinamide-nucleotide amidase
MQAEIISIGDELLIGQTINTNSAWIGEQMNAIGMRIHRATAIADSEQEIINSLNETSQRSQLVFITGGLGPTKDDITKHTLCKYFNTSLVINEEALARITQFFEARGLPMLESNRQQAALPVACTVIQNQKGTACGMWFEKNDTVFISMPGVPYEMMGMMEETIIPKILKHFKRPAIVHRTVLTMGVGESFLATTIADWENSLEKEEIKLAYLPSPGMVKLRLSSYIDAPREVVMQKIATKEKELSQLIGEHIYGHEKETIQSVVGRILAEGKETLSTAESCTGGFIGHLITSVSGSSAYYKGGIISYSNELKNKQLDVPQALIDQYGVVSSEVAKAMAQGARSAFNTTWAVASTGIAGPDGGTQNTPVGTVWLAIAGPEEVISVKFNLGKSRDRTITVASNYALNLLRKEILRQVH